MNYDCVEEGSSTSTWTNHNLPLPVSHVSSSNSKPVCFFCLKDISPSPSTFINAEVNESVTFVNRNKNRHVFPLRNFARLLKFSGLERSLSEKGTVETCEKCARLTEEFTEYNILLEEIQLRVNWCQRKLHEVMQRSENERNALEKEEGCTEESIFARLRRCTILNSRKRVREMLSPVVALKSMRLSRLDEKSEKYRPAFVKDASNEDDGDPTLEDPLLQKDEKESISKLDHDPLETGGQLKSTEEQEKSHSEPFLSPNRVYDSSPDPLALHNPLESSSTPNTLETASTPLSPLTTASENKEHLCCPYCRAIFAISEKTLANKQVILALHIVQYHCEHYFPIQRLDSISPHQYKRILVDLLFRDFYSEDMNKFRCPFCQKSCKSNFNRLNLHLVKKHWKELEVKLISIQQDPQLFEKLRTTNPNGIYCECGVYLVNLLSQSQHLLRHCTLTAPTSKLNEHKINFDVKSNVCPYCKKEELGSGSACTTKLRQHMITFHMEHFFLNARNEALVTEDQFKRIVAEVLFMNLIEKYDKGCRICGKKFGDPKAPHKLIRAKDHFIAEHYEILKEKLDSIQEESNLGETLKRISAGVICSCGMYLKNQRSQAHHRRFFKCMSQPPDEVIGAEADYVDYQDEEGQGQYLAGKHPNNPHLPVTATMPNNVQNQTAFYNPNIMRGQYDESRPFFYHQMNASLHLSVNFQRNLTFEPEPQQQQWNCDKCGYLFFFKEMLQNHQRNDCIYSTTTTANVVDYPAQGQLSTFRNEDVSVRMMNGGTTWEVGSDRCIK